jgi:hydrogenase-4 component E
MSLILLISFAVTLIYLSVTERFRRLVGLITLQGLILFGLALLELKDINLGNLAFIVFETLVFKAIAVPLVLNYLIRQTHISRVHAGALPSFYALIIISFGLVMSLVVGSLFQEDGLFDVFFSVALFTVFTGMFFIISHKKIFSHLIGFLVIENAVFLFSLSLGSHMPMMVNIGILLDIFVSVLILGIFANRIGNLLNVMDAGELSELKD